MGFLKWWTVQDSDSLRSLHKFRQPLMLRQRLAFAGRHLSNVVLVLGFQYKNKRHANACLLFLWWTVQDSNL